MMKETALDVASKGWLVFPCKRNKAPMTRNGFKGATTDEKQICKWWSQNPDANIGVPTGKGSGFFVLDIDLPDGPKGLEILMDKHGELPQTMTARTGSGGIHYYFKHVPGICNSAGKIAPGIDIRGDGGYVIIPPSRNSSGLYKWLERNSIAEAPGWLIDLILKGQSRIERVEGAGRPGEDFEKRGDIRGLLEKHGWKFFQNAGDHERWTRPGKETGTSATLFDDGSLYIFSSNAAPFEAEKRYSKFAVLAFLEHSGDFKATAKALSAEGYGEAIKKKTYHLTELGNAERFADQHQQDVRYVGAWKKWLVYDGKRWNVGASEEVRRMAQDAARGLYNEAAMAGDQDHAAKLGKWAATSSKSASITAKIKEASAMLAIDPDLLDSNPMLFNCNNGTINLKTGLIQPHDRNDYITKLAPVDFDPDATAPTFEAVLNQCLTTEVSEFVQRYFGYAMSGCMKEQCLCFWYGGGQNGKSTILNAVSEAFGDYWQATRPETLMIKYNNQNTSDLAKLKGTRLVTAAEGEEGQRLAESTIKQVTGGEKIQARAMYQDWFEYAPEFKIILCTNHKPVIRGTDYAIWRRIRLIPFSVTIPEAEQDKNLPEKLQAELPGILRWIFEGATKWLSDGLETPEAVKMATEGYQSEQNVIRNFLDCQCIEQGNLFVGASELFIEFEKWRTEEGHRKLTQTKFGRMLFELGYEKGRQPGTGRRIYTGIGLFENTNY